jgi:2-methylisocitrate lyase-like PEP mutase family enzyme
VTVSPALAGAYDAGMSSSPAIATFRELHASGCFVIPNPWDAGSAIALHQLGFRALASTSSGFAFTQGLPDRVGVGSLDLALAHLRALVAATPLPVSADFQAAFARDADEVAINVRRCIETGVAGLSIEDATGKDDAPLYDRATAIERVRAARKAIDASGVPIVLTARCESYLVGDPDAERIAFDRCVAFAAEGADCVFAPRLPNDKLAEFVRAVAPTPVNAIMTGGGPQLSVAQLADLGVRRISVGSALARVAWGAFMQAARSIVETGEFGALSSAISFATLDDMFAGRRSVKLD